MRSGKPPAIPARLEAGRQRFERWRKARKGHSRIPDPLWTSAVKLAGACGLCRTARVPPAPACSPECIVELEDPRGAKMRIHLKGAEGPDLAALSRSFWGIET